MSNQDKHKSKKVLTSKPKRIQKSVIKIIEDSPKIDRETNIAKKCRLILKILIGATSEFILNTILVDWGIFVGYMAIWVYLFIINISLSIELIDIYPSYWYIFSGIRYFSLTFIVFLLGFIIITVGMFFRTKSVLSPSNSDTQRDNSKELSNYQSQKQNEIGMSTGNDKTDTKSKPVWLNNIVQYFRSRFIFYDNVALCRHVIMVILIITPLVVLTGSYYDKKMDKLAGKYLILNFIKVGITYIDLENNNIITWITNQLNSSNSVR